MVLYLIVPILILLFSKYLNKKKFGLFDYILLTVMICICGFRYNVGTDYEIYTRMFLYTDLFNDIEILFNIIIDFVKNFFNRNEYGVYIFFFINSLITITLYYKAIKDNSNKPADSLLYFVCLGYYAMSFNTVRQMLAASIMLYATKYLKSRKILKYLSLSIIASLCHTTALIMIPFYFFSGIKWKKNTLRIMFVFMGLGVFFYQPIYNFVTANIDKYNSYAVINHYTYSAAGVGTYVIALFHIFLIALIINKRKYLIERNSENQIYINLSVISIFFYVLAFVNTVAVRPGYYFSIYLIFLLPDLFDILFKKNHSKNMLVVNTFFILYYIMHLVSFGTMLPYNSIFLTKIKF